jgi:hypothetical protein
MRKIKRRRKTAVQAFRLPSVLMFPHRVKLKQSWKVERFKEKFGCFVKNDPFE